MGADATDDVVDPMALEFEEEEGELEGEAYASRVIKAPVCCSSVHTWMIYQKLNSASYPINSNRRMKETLKKGGARRK